MEINITISCDDDLQDIKTHLSVIRETIVKAYKEAETKGWYRDRELSDSNCYGEYTISMKFEKGDLEEQIKD